MRRVGVEKITLVKMIGCGSTEEDSSLSLSLYDPLSLMSGDWGGAAESTEDESVSAGKTPN